jgi:hypothetical protein
MGSSTAQVPLTHTPAEAEDGRADRLRSRLRGEGRQFALVAVALVVIAAALYGPHVVDGGFLSDSWSIRSTAKFSSGGFFDTVSSYLSEANVKTRPLYAVYLALLNEAFGSHGSLWLLWLVATNVAMCLVLYLLLRRVSVAAFDAGLISALVLIFPAASSLRLWPAVVQAPLTITLALLGMLAAFTAFEARGRRALLIHGGSLALFVASLLLYEVALPIMLASILIYRLRVPWKRAWKRWALDCAVLIPIALMVTHSSTAGNTAENSDIWHHATTIASQTRILFATVVLPFGAAHWYLLALLALLPLAAVAAYVWLPSAHPARGELGRWLLVLAAGVAVVALGYAIYVPGLDYYEPLGAGMANRVNAVPGIGWVLIVYAGAMLAATLALRDLPRARILTSGLAALAAALIAVGWVKTVHSESSAYTTAFTEDERILDTMRAALPSPQPESTIWTFGQPVEIIPGVPVFGNTWDMTGSVQLTYDDPSLRSFVAFPGTTFACRPDGLVPGGNPTYAVGESPQTNVFASPYGKTYFVDTTNGSLIRLRNPAGCHRAIGAFPEAPPFPPRQ